jgi:hypothetical protein
VSLLALGVAAPGGARDGAYADCAEIYRHYVEDLGRRPMSAQRRAALHRWARRAYDACETGDLDNPKGLFEGLDRNRY